MSEDQHATLLVRIVSGTLAGQAFRVPSDRPLLVGRAPECDVSIGDDAELSALHFSLELEDGSCLLRDLGSRNGTRVNRERVRETALHEGDEIRAGATAFIATRSADPRTVPVLQAIAPARSPRKTAAGAPFAAAARRKLGAERSPLFAVLDAALDPRIRLLLNDGGEQVASLYAGYQGELLADVGPSLVQLPQGSRLLDALVDSGWGESWGIFLTSVRPFNDVRAHLRRVLHIEGDAGKQLYFRFYDPRVLRGFLPSCSARHIEALFEDIESFSMEGEAASTLLRFTAQGGRIAREDALLARSG